MHIGCKGFCHFLPPNVGNGIQSQTVVYFVVVIEVLANGIDHESNQLGIFMHEQSDGEITLREEKALG